ncbi:MAG TPA: hypothetical protein VI759_05190 [Dehalococcoidia bacterium]|nr:hypothetical protein [Dehalococcoidia bacterium]
MAAASIRPRLAFAIGVLLILLAALPAGVSAEDILIEGFEGNTSGWFGQNYGLDGCAAHSGAHAMELTSTGGAPGQIAIQFEGDRPEGDYRLTVSVLRLSGSGKFNAQLTWYAADGHELRVATMYPTPGTGSYITTTVSDILGPPQGSARVRLTLGLPAQSPGSVCIDDVTLEGPAEQASTPTPTATLTPQATATPSPTATKPATTTPSPSPTAKAASTTKPSAAEAGAGLVNGGFEDGLPGWQKFGGELRSVAEPHHGGTSAAAFVSTTASTKWAYQVVTVEAGAAYVFSGHVSTDAGVESAYLRVSWYASSDGGGSAIAQVDSTSSVSGASGGFVALTTGAVQAPEGARSARLRAMLDPVSAATVTLYLDDFAFAPAPADAPARTSAQASGSDEAEASAANNAPTAITGSGVARSQVLGSGAGGATEAQAADAAESPPTARIGDGDWSATYVYFAAVALFVIAGGGAYALAKRWPLTLRK